jgi:hypothetical protein
MVVSHEGDHHVCFKNTDQKLNMLSQQDYLPILAESFLIDCKSQGFSPKTIEHYTKKLRCVL